MVPEQRVKTCTYQVCHMVPEHRRQDLHLPGLPHGALEERVKTCCYQVCHMVP